eukprot:403354535
MKNQATNIADFSMEDVIEDKADGEVQEHIQQSTQQCTMMQVQDSYSKDNDKIEQLQSHQENQEKSFMQQNLKERTFKENNLQEMNIQQDKSTQQEDVKGISNEEHNDKQRFNDKQLGNPQYYNQSELNAIFPAERQRICCRCGFYYDNQRYSFNIKNQQQTLHFESQHLEATVQNSIATIRLTQVFINELDEAVEATYSFPTDPDIIVSKLQIELGDRIVEGKIMEKQQAREKYDDAIAGGNAAVLVQEKEKNKDLLEMTIGGINPDQQVKVTLEFIKQLEIEGGAYCLRMPTSYFIKTYGEVSENGVKIKNNHNFDGRKNREPTAQYTLRLLINALQPITYLSIPNQSKLKSSNHKLPTIVEIEELEGNAYAMKKDLLLYFRTTQMGKPLLLAQQSPKHPDEVACLVSLVPTFSPPNPQEEIEILENERPEEQDIIDMKSTDTSKQAYIFIVDRSGSMRGEKMDMTKEALKLFVSSLPPDCLFEIISFGEEFSTTSPNGDGFHNNDWEIVEVKSKIDKFIANMRGTNMYPPLNYALNAIFDIVSEPEDPIQKKIFLLTDGYDGYIGSRRVPHNQMIEFDSVIDKIRKRDHDCAVHTFGIGNDYNKQLVKGFAKAGRGSYSFVEDIDNLKGKIIKALQKAIEPSLQGCRFEFPMECDIQCPREGLIGEAFRNEITNLYLVMKKSVFENFKMSYHVQNDPIQNCSLFQEYNQDEFKMLEDGETLFKLAAKMMIKELDDSYTRNIGNKFKKEIKAQQQMLSIKYQVLCEKTAFVGVVKQDNKHTGELKHVMISTISSVDKRSHYQNQNNQQNSSYMPQSTAGQSQQYQGNTRAAYNKPTRLYGQLKAANNSNMSMPAMNQMNYGVYQSSQQHQYSRRELSPQYSGSASYATSETLQIELQQVDHELIMVKQLLENVNQQLKILKKKEMENTVGHIYINEEKNKQESISVSIQLKNQDQVQEVKLEEQRLQNSQAQMNPLDAYMSTKPLTIKLKPTLETLIDAQSSAGIWTDGRTLSVFLASADLNLDKPSNEEVEKAMKEMLNESGKQNIKQVWLTILALFILREKFDHQEDEWSMIAKKAKNYLKSQGITKIESLLKLINLQLL